MATGAHHSKRADSPFASNHEDSGFAGAERRKAQVLTMQRSQSRGKKRVFLGQQHAAGTLTGGRSAGTWARLRGPDRRLFEAPKSLRLPWHIKYHRSPARG